MTDLVVLRTEEPPDAGRQLAFVMADALASCVHYAAAIAHLDAAAHAAPLPERYTRRRAIWVANRGLVAP